MSTLDETQKSSIDDYDAICAVVQLCLDGEATGDVTKLEKAFHQDARMFGDLAGTRYDVPIQGLFDMAAKDPADTIPEPDGDQDDDDPIDDGDAIDDEQFTEYDAPEPRPRFSSVPS